MQPLIKWPGGKSSEIQYIKNRIPMYSRYVEPFCGGAALFFHLSPNIAILNDASENLMRFYSYIKNDDASFKAELYKLNAYWENLKKVADKHIKSLIAHYYNYKNSKLSNEQATDIIDNIVSKVSETLRFSFNEDGMFKHELKRMVLDKFLRTIKNEDKNKEDLTETDLHDNLLTGFTSGFYMTIRNDFNAMEKSSNCDLRKKTAYFFFIREFCYGSMFRYSKSGDFNIPYGGIAYNNKDFLKKIDNLFSSQTASLLQNTEIVCGDFETIILNATKNDFLFLDPPYDTIFSEYEKLEFGKLDQTRLRDSLLKTKAKFLLIIKNTDFIFNLYNGLFNISSFDSSFSYCVKNRNDRKTKQLIITNY